MSAEVLFIGLDGAEPDLIRSWSDAGLLPNMAACMNEWGSVDLYTPPGFGDGVFWATLFTGCNAGWHGHYFPWQFNPETYGIGTFSFDDHYRRDPFWLFASHMGRRVAVLDIYSAPLTQGLNGVQVMDWMIHDRTGEPRSWPSPLISDLHGNYAADPLGGNSEAESRNLKEWNDMHRGLSSRIDAKTRAVKSLLARDWDLFAVGFCDAHDVGHQSWHWHDPDAPAHSPRVRELFGDPVLKTYQELDRAVGATIEAAKAEHVYLVAGLGMGRQRTANPSLDQALAALSGHEGTDSELTARRRTRPWFDLPHNMNAGAVRINLQGRERNGIIRPEDYDGVCDDLSTRLGTLADADNGEPLVKEVVRVRERYNGPHVDQLPDLMVMWDRSNGGASPGRVQLENKATFDNTPRVLVESRSGDHTQNAMFVSSHRPAGRGPSMPVEHVAPEIGRALRINLPHAGATGEGQ